MDPLIGGALISGGANLLGGLFGSSSAKDINKQQIALSREQMAFQERMSSTAYQRSAKDLEKAGLNRILALGSSASSPGGAQPPSLKVPGEYVQRGISSAVQNLAVMAQIKKLNADTDLSQNRADSIKPEAAVKGAVGNWLESVIPRIQKYGGDFLKVLTSGSTLSSPSSAKDPKINPLPPVYGEREKREEFATRNRSPAAQRSRQREAMYRYVQTYKPTGAQLNAWKKKHPLSSF